jgi:hypothetical protein
MEHIATRRAQRSRRRRALGALAWSTGILLSVLVVSLVVGYLAVSRQRDLILQVSRERDSAEAALARRSSTEPQRMWRRVVQEDFSDAVFPSRARVLSGQWGVSSASLVAEGTAPATLVMPLPATQTILAQIDVEPGGRLTTILGDGLLELGPGEPATGLAIIMDRQLTIMHHGRVLATASLSHEVTGMARRIRIEVDRGILRVLVDGSERAGGLDVNGLRCTQLGLICEPGTIVDNLKVEMPWDEADRPTRPAGP